MRVKSKGPATIFISIAAAVAIIWIAMTQISTFYSYDPTPIIVLFVILSFIVVIVTRKKWNKSSIELEIRPRRLL